MDINKTFIHMLKRNLTALGRKFSDLEPKFDKRVHQLLSMDKIDDQSKSLGYIIKNYKDKYFMLKKKDYRDAAELAMLKDLEDKIIKFSIEDQKIKHTNALSPTEKIKQKIKSYDYPLETLTPKMILSILRQFVRIDDQNYVLVINASGDFVSPYKIKKAMTEKPLLEGDCKLHRSKTYNWKIILISFKSDPF